LFKTAGRTSDQRFDTIGGNERLDLDVNGPNPNGCRFRSADPSSLTNAETSTMSDPETAEPAGDGKGFRPPSIPVRPLDVGVIVACLVVLAALFMPAVQVARTPSKTSQCRNNLRGFGMALGIYHDQWNVYPAGITAWGSTSRYVAGATDCEDPGMSRTNAFVALLPFLEEPRLFDSINHRLATCAVENRTAFAPNRGTFLCPARDGAAETAAGGWFRTPVELTDYALCVGSSGAIAPFGRGVETIPARLDAARGVFNVNSAVRLGDVVDGASFTIAMGEVASGADVRVAPSLGGSAPERVPGTDDAALTPWGMAWVSGLGVDGRVLGGTGSIFFATAHDWLPNPSAESAPGAGVTALSWRSATGRIHRMTLYPTEIRDWSNPRANLARVSVSGLRGRHYRGLVLMLDGGAHAIDADEDPSLFAAYGSIAGRERFDVEPDPLAPDDQSGGLRRPLAQPPK
jgi:hypothetical protein